jgi:hypothetical protein
MEHSEHQITPDCPIDCLRAVLSRRAFNRLARAYQAPFDPPATVADVIHLLRGRQLDDIYGLGLRHIGEITVALVFAGLLSDEVASPGEDHGKATAEPVTTANEPT